MRDSKEYLWFTSDKGICRYDGANFKTFTTANGMPNNEVFNIREDYEGRFWVCSFSSGLCFYKDDKFYTAANTPWLRIPFLGNTVRSYLEKDSTITIMFDLEGFVNIKNDHISVYRYPTSTVLPPAFKVPHHAIKISPNRYKVIYGFGSIDIDTSYRILAMEQFSQFLYHCVGYSFKDPVNYLLSAHNVYSLDHKLLAAISKHTMSFNSAVVARFIRNDLFIGQLNGLLINDSAIADMKQHVTFIEQDKSENIWLGTKGAGAFCISKHYKEICEFKKAYTGQIIRAKTKEGKLLFCTNAGTLSELRGNKIETINKEPVYASGKSLLTYSNILITDKLDFFLFDRDKSFVIPYNKGKRRKIPFIMTDGGGGIKEVVQCFDDIYVFWIFDLKRFSYQDFLSGKKLESPGDSLKNISRILSRAIHKADTSIWFSRKDSLFVFHDNRIVEKQNFRGITFKYFDFYGQYLVGLTEKNVLLITANYKGKRVTESIHLDGYIWNTLYRIDENRLIIATNNYYQLLTFLPPKAANKPRYTIRTLENSFIPAKAEYIAADSSNCFFFKDGNITRVATSVLFAETPSPTPIFSLLSTNKNVYTIKPEIVIPYNESRSMNISFDIISFASKDVVTYYSISKDGNDIWQEIKGREINLNTSGYGTYNIKIKARTLSSAFSPPAELRLVILKPFWATWWFIALCTLAFLALVWGIVQFLAWRKIRKKQKEHEADMKYQQSEYKALNALMNPHFIFNSLNNIQGLINKDEKRTANEYLVIFSDLVRQNMHNVSKGFIPLQRELELVRNYLELEKLRFKDFVNYEIAVDDEVDTEDILIPPLMIQPLVENAVKHGLLPRQSQGSMVWIRVYELDNTLWIEIEDNGVGLTYASRNSSRLHESFTLSNLKKRTDHLKKIQKQEIDISVTEVANGNQVSGTKAVIRMSLSA